MSAVTQAIATALAGVGPTVYTGPVRDSQLVPARAIFVLETTSTTEPLTSGVNLYRRTVQVVVRGNPDSFADAETIANTVVNTLHRTSPTGIVGILASGPTFIQQDRANRTQFSVNLDVTTYGATR